MGTPSRWQGGCMQLAFGRTHREQGCVSPQSSSRSVCPAGDGATPVVRGRGLEVGQSPSVELDQFVDFIIALPTERVSKKRKIVDSTIKR